MPTVPFHLQPPSNRAVPKVLVAFEESGSMRRAFLDRGYDAYSCDLQRSRDNSPRHIVGDVRPLLQLPDWDLILVCHPPCTRLANSGVQWLRKPCKKLNREHYSAEQAAAYLQMDEEQRLAFLWDDMRRGAALFSDCLASPCERVAIENPVMHKYAKAEIENYQEFAFSCHPWQFGDTTKKRTCWWTKNLPDLVPTDIVPEELRTNDTHNEAPGPNRSKNRSKSFPGMCNAIADQWGRHCEEQLFGVAA